jgi:aarF domain-containing kinase
LKGLALSLARGTVSSYYHGNSSSSQPALSEANVNSLVEKLGRMRGAALKLGQFMSIQGMSLTVLPKNLWISGSDTHTLSPELDQVFLRVQNSAHYMPHWQLEVLLLDSDLYVFN